MRSAAFNPSNSLMIEVTYGSLGAHLGYVTSIMSRFDRLKTVERIFSILQLNNKKNVSNALFYRIRDPDAASLKSFENW